MFQNWLSPVRLERISEAPLLPHHFGTAIELYDGTAATIDGVKLALIGMDQQSSDAVRKALYRLSFPFSGLKISDLGNVRNKEVAFLIPLLKELTESGIFPIMVSPSPLHCLAQYKAFHQLRRYISWIVVDERIAYSDGQTNDPANYLNDIVSRPEYNLFHLGAIGCQGHFADNRMLNVLERQHHEVVRLGMVRSNLPEAEPIIRDGDLLSFHLSALKQSEAPGQKTPSPNGFTTEEACRLSRYAGMSDKLKSFGIFGLDIDHDIRHQTVQLVAQMIWYFIEGFYHRKEDYPASTDGLVEYIVDLKNMDYQLTFWKSSRSGRWWLQIPVKTKGQQKRHRLIPCSYADYNLACNEELPDRLLKALRRFD